MNKEKIDSLTQKKLKKILHYDPENGIFTWLKRPVSMFKLGKYQLRSCNTWNTRYSGTTAGSYQRKKNSYYNSINISNGKVKLYKAHRLAFLYMTGSFPNNEVDHINGITLDNRWINLRDVTHHENNKNISISSKNTSGFTGVSFDKSKGKWVASISVNNKTVSGGRFINKEDAIVRRKEMSLEYGFHKNHGRI